MIAAGFKGNAARFKKAMANHDGDADGRVTHDEFIRVLMQLGTRLNPGEHEVLMRTFDPEGQGTIDYHKATDVIYMTDGTYKEKLKARSVKKVLDKIQCESVSLKKVTTELSSPQPPRTSLTPPPPPSPSADKYGLDNLSTMFASLDDNKDGSVSYDELRRGLGNLGLQLSDAEFAGVVDVADKDGDGKIEYREFARNLCLADLEKARIETEEGKETNEHYSPHMRRTFHTTDDVSSSISRRHLMSEDDRKEMLIRHNIANRLRGSNIGLKRVFEGFDVDNSGSLDSRELKQGLASIGITLSDQDFTRLMSQVDGDADGKVSYDEFRKVRRMGRGGGGGRRDGEMERWRATRDTGEAKEAKEAKEKGEKGEKRKARDWTYTNSLPPAPPPT